MKHRQATPLLLLTLYGLLIAALLVLTLAGARCYAAAADSRQRHDRVNDPADNRSLASADPGHQVKLENSDQAPVDAADNG